MPFASDKQRKYLYAKHPKVAKKWSEEGKKKARKKRGKK